MTTLSFTFPDSPARLVRFVPVAVPATETVAFSEDADTYVDCFIFTNADNAAEYTVTVKDVQFGLVAINAQPVPANSDPVVVYFPGGGRIFPQGFKWSCSTNAKVIGWARILRRD